MTPEGRTFVMMRMSDAPTIEALKSLWENNIGAEYKQDAAILKHKNQLKEQFERERQ